MTISKQKLEDNTHFPDPSAVADFVRRYNEFGNPPAALDGTGAAILAIAKKMVCDGISEQSVRKMFGAAVSHLHLLGSLPAPVGYGGLTRAQHKTLMVLREYVARHGYSPSYDEIREVLGLASKSGVHRMISALKERGYLTSSGGVRDLLITQKGMAASQGVDDGKE